MKNVAFTICAKNYLAQAITLKKSFEQHNPESDFFIYLADEIGDGIDKASVRELDVSWIPAWKEMAFKYDVVEFNTAIKPFCINHLFNQGYDKVAYLDPDTYVKDSFQYIWDVLDRKSILLTPHYFSVKEHFDGAVGDAAILGQGVFNLGFGAYRATPNGRKLISWWMAKLKDQCYVESSEGMFVDQKWMNYAPVFFPDDVEISHHAGVNVAIWNLHERELLIENGKYVIRRFDGEKFPLVLFHFSGFDPFEAKVINRRHPQYNVDTYPSFKPIIEEYRKSIYDNGYDKYSVMPYSFSTFSNGENIIVMQRRLFRKYVAANKPFVDPFDTEDSFYKVLKKHGCLTKVFSSNIRASKGTKETAGKMEKRFLVPMAKLLKKILGIRWYFYFVRYATQFRKPEYHDFLIK